MARAIESFEGSAREIVGMVAMRCGTILKSVNWVVIWLEVGEEGGRMGGDREVSRCVLYVACHVDVFQANPCCMVPFNERST